MGQSLDRQSLLDAALFEPFVPLARRLGSWMDACLASHLCFGLLARHSEVEEHQCGQLEPLELLETASPLEQLELVEA